MSVLARNTDPITSKLAAVEIRRGLKELQTWTVKCVEQTPGLTQRELGDVHCPEDLRKIGRRLNEVEALGMNRRGAKRLDRITGRMAETWLPVSGKPEDTPCLF